MMKKFSVSAGVLLCLALVPAAQAAPAYIPLPGGYYDPFIPFALSADGSIAAGTANTSDGTPQAGVIYRDGALSTVTENLTGISADGSVVVGRAANFRGGRWVNGALVDDFGANMQPVGVSADGSVVAIENAASVWSVYWDIGNLGISYPGNAAYVWRSGVGLTSLDMLSGTRNSANAISGDGSTVVGYGYLAGNAVRHATRWSSDTGAVTDLGTLGGLNSRALAVSADGSTVVGDSALSGDAASHAVQWKNSVVTDLGTLGGTNSWAGGISADGKIVVGTSQTTDDADHHAVRWKNGVMADLNDVAAEAGIDMTGITLSSAHAISADGTTIAGLGTMGGAYLLRLDAGSSGIITPEELAESLTPSVTVGQQGSASVSQGLGYSMFTAARAFSSFSFAPPPSSPASPSSHRVTGVSGGSAPSQASAYATGTLGMAGQKGDADNFSLSGGTGMLFCVSDHWAVGGGIVAGGSRAETPLGGRSDLASLGGSLLASYQEGASGLRVFGAATVARLESDTRRHYANGAGIDGSHGETHGVGYGGAVHAGWVLPLVEKTTVEPYAELEYSKLKMNAYTEQGGAFAASYGDHSMDRTASRLGASVDRQVTETLVLGVHAAWGHRLAGDGGAYTASASGIALPLTGGVGDRNWAEGGISGTVALSSGASLSADLTGRSGRVEEPRAQATVGVNWAF